MPWPRFVDRHNAIAKKIYSTLTRLMPGAKEALQQLREDGYKLALASSSPHLWIYPVIERFGLKEAFDAIVSAEDIVGLSKPSPDIYIETASRLGVNPAECVAIEDSRNGIKSAKDVGMKVLGYKSDDNLEQDISGADAIINDLLKVLNIVRE